MIIGNEDAQRLVRDSCLLPGNVLVYGPSGLGKWTALVNHLETQQLPYLSVLPHNPISEIREFITHKEMLVVRDAHQLSEAAQDAFLKVMESDVKVVFVCDDVGLLSDALMSRFQSRIRFNPIPKDLLPGLDDFCYLLSGGSYSDAEFVQRNPDLTRYLASIISAKPSDLLMSPIPSFLKTTDKDESFLRVISRGLLIAGRHRHQACHFAALASDVLKTPSMNLGLHIQTLAVGLLNDSLD